MGWYEQRFTPREGAIEKRCKSCGRGLWLPPSRAGDYATCGGECATNRRSFEAAKRTRDCETCGKPFTPRPNQLRVGHGRYCSQKCNAALRAAGLAPDVTERRLATMRSMRERGEINYPRGEAHPSWKGGVEAQKERRRPKMAASLRKYRKANPHKVREWKHRRSNGKVLPRLPYGTIPRLGELQRWKCAICRIGIKCAYHVDHIMPIAKGGKHEPRNLQLLCATCNVRKNSKDPIAYMQEVGRLL